MWKTIWRNCFYQFDLFLICVVCFIMLCLSIHCRFVTIRAQTIGYKLLLLAGNVRDSKKRLLLNMARNNAALCTWMLYKSNIN